jgi:hypothetical protein
MTLPTGSLGTGLYTYKAVYEWTDNLGRVVRSTTSEPQEITFASGTTNATSVRVPTLRLTNKESTRSPVRIVLYRTEANGSVLYRLTPLSSPLFNDTTIDYVSYTDTLADGYLTSRERIYTDGDVLDTDAPPHSTAIATYRNRVWLAGLENPQQLWYSQQLVEGEAVGFSQYFTAQTDFRGGRITALQPLDDALVIFKENAVFRISGEGPNNTGGGSFYDDPQLITTDVGCTNPNSIATTPEGLVFQSAKGIMLLDRSYGVSYIGAPVERYNALTITSTTVVPDQNIIVFTTSTDPALVYDYYFQQWSTFTNHFAVDSILWRRNFVYLRSDGFAFSQTAREYTDNGTHIPLKLRTGYIKLSQLQGFQRVKGAAILGEFKGTHKLLVRAHYDYNDTFTDSYVVEPAEVFASNLWGSGYTWGSDDVWGGRYSPYHFVIPTLTQQKCQSIAFSIQDTQESSPNEGYSITGLTLEVGTKRGLNKVPYANKIG